jgi:hypothetical protein
MDKLERVLNMQGYRKLTAFVVSCGLLLGGAIDQGTWLAVAMAFLGAQALTDLRRKP